MAVIGAVLAGGCGATRPVDGDGMSGVALPGPFAPELVRVYPLTHVDTDEQGRGRIVLHVELRDRWGDTVKGAGLLQVQLLRGTGLGESGPSEEQVRWEIDLRDPDENAAFYDPSTRTYRVPLGDVPDWLKRSVGEASGGRRVTLSVIFRTPDGVGRERVLTDEYVLGG